MTTAAGEVCVTPTSAAPVAFEQSVFQQQVRSTMCSLHLLPLGKALTDDGVHGGLNEG